MAYIGIQPAEKFTSFATQEFSTSATTSYTLDHAVANENEIALFVNNVRQQPGSGKDALTSAPASTDEFLVSDAGTIKRVDASLVGRGKLLQAVTATDSTGRSTTSTSFVTGSNTLSVDITPSATSSKIFLMANGNCYMGTSAGYVYLTIFRDSTDLGASSNKGLGNLYKNPDDVGVPYGISFLDSPSSTSEITYQVYFRVSAGTGTLNESGSKASLTAFEIAG